MKAADEERNFWGRPAGSGPRVIGHRGAARTATPASGASASGGGPIPRRAARAPVENTLTAFREAIDQGAVAVELDVRVAASGEVIVFHDPTLERLTEGRDLRPIAALSAAELGRVELDIGASGRASAP